MDQCYAASLVTGHTDAQILQIHCVAAGPELVLVQASRYYESGGSKREGMKQKMEMEGEWGWVKEGEG